jgi:NADH-quinone oxidoreductase subunit E
MRFSVDTVNCLGCCALGPVMLVDGQYYSKPSKEELEQLAAAG